ncbi:MAG: DNA-binding protein [Rhodanobacteraceae bacterium]|nr:MAG: DNA-binding protein [Rhodanobacteraceae bacterium]
MTPTTRSLQQTRELFAARGIVTAEWAKEHGFSPDLVYGVLTGRLRGRRGQAHRIAIALGLKADPRADAHGELPARNREPDRAQRRPAMT